MISTNSPIDHYLAQVRNHLNNKLPPLEIEDIISELHAHIWDSASEISRNTSKTQEQAFNMALQSLEDPLAILIRPGWLRGLAGHLLPLDGGRMARLLLLWGQKKLEREHSKIRERLLKSDQSESDLLAFSGRPE